MLSKLIKHDLKRSFSWLWILCAITVAVSGLTRLIGLGSGTFFVIVKGIFAGITTALIANVLIQPFIRFFITFQKDAYGDESYLTHTLPITKDQILFSRYISAFVQLVFALIVTVLSIFILYWTPQLGDNLQQMFIYFTQNFAPGNIISFNGLAILLVLLIFLSFVLLTVTGYTSVVIANKCPNKKTLIAVILTIVLMYIQNFILGIVSLVICVVFVADIT